MTFDPDKLLDRRRLKRGVIAWRAVAIAALVALVVVGVGRFGVDGLRGREHVVRLWVDGIIVEEPEREAALAELADDADVKAVIVRINSPGGTAVGGEMLYLSLRRVGAAKPVVAVLGTTATSAGYMVALAAERIIAREATLTGSIGVILQTAEFTRLLDDIGIETEAIKSGPLKAVPSPLEPLDAATRAASRAVVNDIFEVFVGMVMERRTFSRARALAVADGRVFTGRQAVAHDLVDAIGGEREAQTWLAETHGIDTDLPVRDLWGEADDSLWGRFKVWTRTLLPKRLTLDGLLAVWHPGFGD